MKTDSHKKFDAVQMMRSIRKKISGETRGMSFEELKKYIELRVRANESKISHAKNPVQRKKLKTQL